jgi:hypothetical protein
VDEDREMCLNRQIRHLGYMGSVLLCLVCTPCAAQSPRDVQTQSEQTRERRLNTEAQLRALYSVILAFQRHEKAWPLSLNEACDPFPEKCLLLDAQEKPTDSWGSPVSYRARAEDVELRSSGPDQKSGTSDDLVISYALEGRIVSRLIGCYQPIEGWWAPTPTIVSLDTVPAGSEYRGTYPLQINLPTRTDFTEWFPIDRDSIALEWASGPHLSDIRLLRRGDSLEGRVDLEYVHLEGPRIWRGVLRLVKTRCEE